MLKARKLSGRLPGTFNFVNNHVKKPSIRTEKFRQMRGGKQVLTLQERKHEHKIVLGSVINGTYIIMIIETMKSDLTKNCNIAILAKQKWKVEVGDSKKLSLILPVRKPIVKVYNS